MNEELRRKYAGKWNWGAFFLPGVWPLAHGYIPLGIFFLLVAVGPLVLPAFRLEFIAITLLGRVILGLKGTDMALARREFESENDFVNSQDIWRNVGLGTTAVLAILASFKVAITSLG